MKALSASIEQISLKIKRLTPEFCPDLLLQPFDDALAQLEHFLVGQGTVLRLVGQAVGQALLTRTHLLAAEDIEQAQVCQHLAERSL